MIADFIDHNRATFGVESICKALKFALSAVLLAQMASDRARSALSAAVNGRNVAGGRTSGMGGQFPSLWSWQSLAPASPGRLQ